MISNYADTRGKQYRASRIKDLIAFFRGECLAPAKPVEPVVEPDMLTIKKAMYRALCVKYGGKIPPLLKCGRATTVLHITIEPTEYIGWYNFYDPRVSSAAGDSTGIVRISKKDLK